MAGTKPLIGYRMWGIRWLHKDIRQPIRPVLTPLIFLGLNPWFERNAEAICQFEFYTSSARVHILHNLHSCGIYSMKTIQGLLDEFFNWTLEDCGIQLDCTTVMGIVGNYGAVVEGEEGYRAEKAVVMGFYTTGCDDLQKHSELYHTILSSAYSTTVGWFVGRYNDELATLYDFYYEKGTQKVLNIYDPYGFGEPGRVLKEAIRGWMLRLGSRPGGEMWVDTFALREISGIDEAYDLIKSGRKVSVAHFTRVHDPYLQNGVRAVAVWIQRPFFEGREEEVVLRLYEFLYVHDMPKSYLLRRLAEAYGVPLLRVPDSVEEWARRKYRRRGS